MYLCLQGAREEDLTTPELVTRESSDLLESQGLRSQSELAPAIIVGAKHVTRHCSASESLLEQAAVLS